MPARLGVAFLDKGTPWPAKRALIRTGTGALSVTELAAQPTITQLGKEIVEAHYGQAAHHTYISGCSTGGRESMLAVRV